MDMEEKRFSEEEVQRPAALLARLCVDIEQASTQSPIYSDLTPIPSHPPTTESNSVPQTAAKTTPPLQNMLTNKSTRTTTEGLDVNMPRKTPDRSTLGANHHILAGPKPGGVRNAQPSMGNQRIQHLKSSNAAVTGDEKNEASQEVKLKGGSQVSLPKLDLQSVNKTMG